VKTRRESPVPTIVLAEVVETPYTSKERL